MKAILKRMNGDQQGVALVLALVVLLVGGLITAGLLSHMGAGLLAQDTYNRRTAELYAADAGVDHAVWSISHQAIPFDAWEESTDESGWWIYHYPEPLIVNGKKVDVTVYRKDLDPTCGEELIYRILATAIAEDGGNTAAIDSSTTVESYLSVAYMDFSSLLDYAIVSQHEIIVRPNNYVDGDVWLPNGDDLTAKEDAIGGEVYDSVTGNVTWPGAGDLSSYYLEDVDPDDPYLPGSVDVNDTKTMVPCYREGDLTIDNTGAPDTLTLGGTIYVHDGDLVFAQAGGNDYTIDLNGQTIFVEGDFTCASQSIGIAGSGCIIATGNIIFQPSVTSEPDDFVLILSIGVGSSVTVQPNGSFTGCIAGNDVVTLQPGDPHDEFTLAWTDPEGKNLNFPMGIGDDSNELPPVIGLRIDSWEISQQ
jgi:hypothetical protein